MSGDWLALGAIAALAGASATRRGSAATSPSCDLGCFIESAPDLVTAYLQRFRDHLQTRKIGVWQVRETKREHFPELILDHPGGMTVDVYLQLEGELSEIVLFMNPEDDEEETWMTTIPLFKASLSGTRYAWSGDFERDHQTLIKLLKRPLAKIVSGEGWEEL